MITMGTPLPPNEPGNNCDVCWGPGKLFGDGPTPTIIQLRLTSLLPGEFEHEADFDNLLVTHWLVQRGLPCVFTIFDGPLEWTVGWNPANTTVSVTNVNTLRQVFFNSTDAKCLVDLPNKIIVPAAHIAYNGFANVTWDLEGLP